MNSAIFHHAECLTVNVIVDEFPLLWERVFQITLDEQDLVSDKFQTVLSAQVCVPHRSVALAVSSPPSAFLALIVLHGVSRLENVPPGVEDVTLGRTPPKDVGVTVTAAVVRIRDRGFRT